jgi:MFS family permease
MNILRKTARELTANASRYNIGVLATIYVHPGFKKALYNPSPSKVGLITSIYYLGTWISYIFLSHLASDRLGRRWAAWLGALVTCVGAALQASAGGSGGFAMMIVGRIICGLGVAVVSTSVPLYQRFVGSRLLSRTVYAKGSIVVKLRQLSSEGVM